MALYFGNEKFNINIDGVVYNIAKALILEGISLLSFDGFRLMDSNGLYLTVEEDE